MLAAVPAVGFTSLRVVKEAFGAFVDPVAGYTVRTGALLILRADAGCLSLKL